MKRTLIILLILSFFVNTSGCLGKVDVNRLTTAAAVGVDKGEEGYKVTVQAINASALTQELSARSTIVVYSEEGKTFFEALRKLTKYFPSRVFMGHFQLVVFGEEFAKSGEVDEVLGFLYNDPETRQKYNFAIVKGGTASDLLKILTPVSPNPANEINSSIEASEKNYGLAHMLYIDEFISCVRSTLYEAVVTGIEYEGDLKEGSELKNLESSEVKAKIKIDSLAVFKKDKLVGWLSEDESQGYNYLENNVLSGVIPVQLSKEEKLTIEIVETSSKVKFKLKENKPTINYSVNLSGIVSGLDNGIYMIKMEDSKKIMEDVSKSLKEKIEGCIKRAQGDLNSDFLGIGALIHRSNPGYYKQIKDKYDEVFKEFEIKVDVKMKVINSPQ